MLECIFHDVGHICKYGKENRCSLSSRMSLTKINLVLAILKSTGLTCHHVFTRVQVPFANSVDSDQAVGKDYVLPCSEFKTQKKNK